MKRHAIIVALKAEKYDFKMSRFLKVARLLGIATFMHTKIKETGMGLGVVSNATDVDPPHFFHRGLKFNAANYYEVLERVVKPWTEILSKGISIIHYTVL